LNVISRPTGSGLHQGSGWHQGHTVTCILEALRLVSWNRQADKIKLTAKGRHYIDLAFKASPALRADLYSTLL
jgi:hypothetical protein